MQYNATWIWYPGDFEVWLGNIFNNRRTERGAMFPPFWKQDSHYPTVEFTKVVELEEAEDISILAEGQFNVSIDGKLLSTPLTSHPSPLTTHLSQGKHRLSIKVWNQATPPAIFVSGKTVCSDASWLTTYEDKIWIDEHGVAHASGIYVPVGSWCFDSPDFPPSHYHLECEERHPVSSHPVGTDSQLYDFGKEVFGYLRLSDLKGTVHIYYGESREEALDKEHCETLDVLTSAPSPLTPCPLPPLTSHLSPLTSRPLPPLTSNLSPLAPCPLPPLTSNLASKAFRFVYIEKEDGASYDDVWMDYEYAPHDPNHSGSFRCSDEEINRIWDVAAYTLDLTTREFFMDGIKRDRWTWSGDAIQSYLMNYYLRFDSECVKRTIRQLRGKDPVTAHVNTIMDYTFYWFKSILDYYDYTADADFLREMWPRMVTLMDYVLSRTNSDGMAEGQPDDWIFVDWTDFPMPKRGALCFEQILLMKALETMARCQELLNVPLAPCSSPLTSNHSPLTSHLATLRQKIKETFWNPEQQAYMHAIEDGALNSLITKFPNMFAILYGLSDEQQRQQIMNSVMLNPKVAPITTPYMRFYELETLCMGGMHQRVLQEMRDYWGGMLREGATTFWEKYNPELSGTQHLAMYGRPYGKSLCHAWGASPIYLLGKYYLGVRPTLPGYAAFEVRPHLGGLDWIEGDVPTPHGMIHVYMDRHQVRVRATEGHGTLYVGNQEKSIDNTTETVVSY